MFHTVHTSPCDLLQLLFAQFRCCMYILFHRLLLQKTKFTTEPFSPLCSIVVRRPRTASMPSTSQRRQRFPHFASADDIGSLRPVGGAFLARCYVSCYKVFFRDGNLRRSRGSSSSK